MFVIISVNFLTGFLQINGLWIRPRHYFNIYRLVVWFLLANLAFVEGWEDLKSWGKSEREGKHISAEYRWLTSAVLAVEVLISYKYRHDTGNLVEEPWPWYIALPWIIVFIAITVHYLRLRFVTNRTDINGFPLEGPLGQPAIDGTAGQSSSAKKTQ
jgi:hypothetical protein